jgi:hypothetical protein
MMKMKATLVVAVIAIGTVLPCWPGVALAQTAAAQPPPCASPSRQDVEAAKTAYGEGEAARLAGNYKAAIVAWQTAHRLDCTAYLLQMSLALVYELDGQFEHAAQALEIYLKARKPPTQAEEAAHKQETEATRSRIENLRARHQEQLATAKMLGEVAELEKELEKAKAEAQQAKATPPKPVPPKLPPARRRSFDPDILLYSSMAATAIGAITAVAYVADVGKMDELDEACGGRRTACNDPEAIAAGNAARKRTQVLGPVSLASMMLGGGLVAFYVWDPLELRVADKKSVTMRVGPVVSRDYTGIRLKGQF